jgi:hydroxymethylpyrimidine pyrophosphatase-like HAD family hydrolase
MPIRLVAVDLDGTLLNPSATISPANCQALAEAVARGVQVVVVTGRRFQSAKKILQQLPCPFTLISSNGAMTVSESGEVLHRDFLPQQIAERVLEKVRLYRPYAVAIFEVPGRGQVAMEQCAVPEGPLGWYLTHSPELLMQVPNLEEVLTPNLIQLMFGGPPERVGPIEPFLRDAFQPPQFHLTWTKYLARNLSILDVMNLGCTKGRALASWAERCGIPANEVMAIGDNFNDIEMLEFAGVPVLMGNRSAGLEREGWAVTLSNDQDGVAEALQRFVLMSGEPARRSG